MIKLSLTEFRDILSREARYLVNRNSLDERSDINNGYCGDFARSVRDTIRSEYGGEYLIWSKGDDIPTVQKHSYGTQSMKVTSHVWLEYQGFHFDAECIEGADSPEKLPIFERNYLSDDELV